MSKRKELRELYAKVPRVKCKGLCSESCGPIECSDEERKIIERRAGKRLETVRHPRNGPLTCSMLSPNGHCSVYGDRPMICRLWGAVPEMPCPHGCEVEGEIGGVDSPDMEGFQLLAQSFVIGGGMRARMLTDGISDVKEAFEKLTPEEREMLKEHVARGMRNDARKMGRP